jgi:mycothiol synthase
VRAHSLSTAGTTRTELLARVENIGRLDPDELRGVSLLVERATEADGVRPLSEETTLGTDADLAKGVRHILVYTPHASPGGGRLTGYGRLDPGGGVDGARAELIVDPSVRSHGVGRLLVRHLLAGSPRASLCLWAYGDLAPARSFAHALGFTDCRRLHQLLRSPLHPPPRGVSEVTRYVDKDDAAALRLSERLGFVRWQSVACYRQDPAD